MRRRRDLSANLAAFAGARSINHSFIHLSAADDIINMSLERVSHATSRVAGLRLKADRTTSVVCASDVTSWGNGFEVRHGDNSVLMGRRHIGATLEHHL